MKWTVIWQVRASDALAEIWLAATDRQQVTDAANRIDAALAVDPERIGREFAEFRAYDDAPLSVLFQASSLDCKVTVVDVWLQVAIGPGP